MAGNKSVASGAKPQLTGIRNRCCDIEIYPDVKYWLENYAIPKQIHPIGISFFDMDMYTPLFYEEEQANLKFGSARSWTSLFNMITRLELQTNNQIPLTHLNSVITGSVGDVSGSKFLEYFKIYSKIDTKKIFKTGEFTIENNKISENLYAIMLYWKY